MIKESKYRSDVMEKHFNKELVMTKEDDEDFEILVNVGFVTIFMLRVILKYEVMAISMEKVEALHKETGYQD